MITKATSNTALMTRHQLSLIKATIHQWDKTQRHEAHQNAGKPALIPLAVRLFEKGSNPPSCTRPGMTTDAMCEQPMPLLTAPRMH
eukprot:scaffold15355_cov21-Tisochrysis_lutea.AAC.1